MPYISIIVPVYNTGEALNNCLKSIVMQNFIDIEIIIVDDGSTDISTTIYKKFAEADNRIRVLRQNNKGVSFSRNLGIQKAMGMYILFVDSDDYIPSNYCQEMINAQRVYGDSSFIITGMVRIENGINYVQKYENKKISCALKSDVLKLHDNNLLNCPTNKLYSAKKIKENSILFNGKISIAEDLLFNLSYLECLDDVTIVILNDIHYNYIKMNSKSLSQRYHKNFDEIHSCIYQYFFDLCVIWEIQEEDYSIWYKTRWWLMKKNLENTMLNESWSLYEKIKYNNSFLKSDEFRQIMKKNRKTLFKSEYILFLVGQYEFILLMHKFYDIYNKICKIKNKGLVY